MPCLIFSNGIYSSFKVETAGSEGSGLVEFILTAYFIHKMKTSYEYTFGLIVTKTAAMQHSLC